MSSWWFLVLITEGSAQIKEASTAASTQPSLVAVYWRVPCSSSEHGSRAGTNTGHYVNNSDHPDRWPIWYYLVFLSGFSLARRTLWPPSHICSYATAPLRHWQAKLVPSCWPGSQQRQVCSALFISICCCNWGLSQPPIQEKRIIKMLKSLERAIKEHGKELGLSWMSWYVSRNYQGHIQHSSVSNLQPAMQMCTRQAHSLGIVRCAPCASAKVEVHVQILSNPLAPKTIDSCTCTILHASDLFHPVSFVFPSLSQSALRSCTAGFPANILINLDSFISALKCLAEAANHGIRTYSMETGTQAGQESLSWHMKHWNFRIHLAKSPWFWSLQSISWASWYLPLTRLISDKA